MSIWSLTCQQSVYRWHHNNEHYKRFTHKMAAKTSWHRYGTKLRHCHHMYISFWFCSVLFFSRPRSYGCPHHGRTFSIFSSPLSFWLTLSLGVLSTFWCCPSRPCVVFLACVHLALFPALSLSPGNSLVSSWCDHSMLAFLFWRRLTVPSLLQLCQEPTRSFSFAVHETRSNFLSLDWLQRNGNGLNTCIPTHLIVVT